MSTSAFISGRRAGGGGGDAQGDVLSLIEDLEGSAHGDRLDGDGGDNAISGGAGSDTLRGEAGDDLLSGGGDGDHVTGNLGDDTLAGGGGADTLAGGGGRDLADYAASPSGVDVRLWAGTGSGGDAAGDVLTGIEDLLGSPFTDRLEGGVEANEIRGGSGDDTLRGANGDDLLAGGTGADELRGGAGDDTLIGGAGADALYGGGETDMADYSASPVGVDVRLFTGTGAGGDAAGDSLTGIENLVGSVHADRLDGDGGANAISGGTGSDSLRGDQGDDHLSGGAGADSLLGNSGDDTLLGGAGGDTLNGGVGNDFASYATSPLGVKIDLRDGTVSGGDAQGDVLSLIENLEGSAHRDTLFGDSGGNMIEGGGGDDILVGMEGDDTLRGGAGPDNLTGNSGADTFFYLDLSDGTIITANETVAASELFRDRVMDFVSGTDDFALDSPNFEAAAAFDTIAQAYDGTNSNVSSGSAVIFDGSHLIYDPDVNTAGYTVIAEVQGDAVVATDIVFV